jgi:hypothetical protein
MISQINHGDFVIFRKTWPTCLAESAEEVQMFAALVHFERASRGGYKVAHGTAEPLRMLSAPMLCESCRVNKFFVARGACGRCGLFADALAMMFAAKQRCEKDAATVGACALL